MAPYIQLTTLGAVNPYGVCFDEENCLWVAAKGGLFKFDQQGNCLFSEKHDRPRAMNAFSSISSGRDSDGVNVILTKYSEVNSDETTLALYGLDGQRKATNIIDGTVKSACMTKDGTILLVRHTTDGKNEICKINVDDFYTLTTIIVSSDDFEFLHISASVKHNIIAVTSASIPVNPYSKQRVQIYELDTGLLVKTFGEDGKEAGKIWCPRGIKLNKNGDVLILDKTGRIQQFSVEGDYIANLADVPPAGLSNGFCINEKESKIYIACSGLVEETVDDIKTVVCSDWIEELKPNFEKAQKT